MLWAKNALLLDHAGRKTPLCAQDLAIVDRSQPWSIEDDDGCAAQWFDFGTRSFLLRTRGRRRDLTGPIDGQRPLALLVKRLWSIGLEFDTMGIDAELIPQRLTDIIGTLCGMLVTSDGSLSSHKATTLERAEQFIAGHLHETTLSPATLAAGMRISTRHLSSLFAAIGTTTTKAILAQRLARARSLLADPANRSRQIGEIAIACGFTDQGYFARCFRTQQGVTPKIFRENMRRSDKSAHCLG